jgi:hypothetical protein
MLTMLVCLLALAFNGFCIGLYTKQMKVSQGFLTNDLLAMINLMSCHEE